MTVAPLTGAWIETTMPKSGWRSHSSHPSRVRGLKPGADGDAIRGVVVAPLTGAWIETIRSALRVLRVLVAPLTGAWIETYCPQCSVSVRCVAPLTGAWIETRQHRQSWQCWRSHPSRVRGLKHRTVPAVRATSVAPLTGAWIETRRR